MIGGKQNRQETRTIVPTIMAEDVQLWMQFDGRYRLALSIPVNDCQRFSTRPLAWLRYVAFTIYGNEGDVSTLRSGPAVDYNQADIGPGAYYYVSEAGESFWHPNYPSLTYVRRVFARP